jgi:hypothetical protein
MDNLNSHVAGDDGGPAFPLVETSAADSVTPGMSLRDYFIAHAPAEPQLWFQPAMPKPPERPAYLDRKTLSDVALNELEAFNEDMILAEDITTGDLRRYAEQLEGYLKASRAFSAEAEKQRYVRWPAAWADEMLRARKVGAA